MQQRAPQQQPRMSTRTQQAVNKAKAAGARRQFAVDPMWQKKMANGGNTGSAHSVSSTFRPTQGGGGGGFNTPQLGRYPPSRGSNRPDAKFNAKAFLQTQKKGQYLRRGAGGSNDQQSHQQQQQQQQQQSSQQQQFQQQHRQYQSHQQQAKGFDINQYKAMAPKMQLNKSASPTHANRGRQVSQNGQVQYAGAGAPSLPVIATTMEQDEEQQQTPVSNAPMPWKTTQKAAASDLRIGKGATSKDILARFGSTLSAGKPASTTETVDSRTAPVAENSASVVAESDASGNVSDQPEPNA